MNDGLFVYIHVCMLLVSLGHWCSRHQVWQDWHLWWKSSRRNPINFPILLWMKIRIVDGFSSYLRMNITSNHISPRYSSLPSRHPSLSTHLMKHLLLHPRLRTGSADTILRAIEELTFKNTTFLIYRARMDCDSCSEEINGNFGSKKSVSFDTKLRRHEQRRRYLHF